MSSSQQTFTLFDSIYLFEMSGARTRKLERGKKGGRGYVQGLGKGVEGGEGGGGVAVDEMEGIVTHNQIQFK